MTASKSPDEGTPRTDAAELDHSYFSDRLYGPSGYVKADFARTLETELAAAREDALEEAANQLEERARQIKVISSTTDGYWHSSNYSDQWDLLMREAQAIRELGEAG